MPPRPSSRSTGYDPSIDGVAIGLGAFYCAGSPDVLMDLNLSHAADGLSYPDFTKENHDGRPQEEVDEVHEASPHP